MNFELTKQSENILSNYCEMTNYDATSVLNRLIESELARYIPEEGFGQKGTYIEGNSELAQKVSEVTGEKVRISETPCIVLGKCKIYEYDYYRIFALGNILKVPANKKQIRLETEEFL